MAAQNFGNDRDRCALKQRVVRRCNPASAQSVGRVPARVRVGSEELIHTFDDWGYLLGVGDAELARKQASGPGPRCVHQLASSCARGMRDACRARRDTQVGPPTMLLRSVNGTRHRCSSCRPAKPQSLETAIQEFQLGHRSLPLLRGIGNP